MGSLRFESMIDPWPIRLPTPLWSWLSEPLHAQDEDDLREAIRRNAPYGEESWRKKAAQAWGLEPTMKRRGRPHLGNAALGSSPQLELDAG